MKMNSSRSVLAALLISPFLNVVWIALEAVTSYSEYWSSRLRGVFRLLDSPAFVLNSTRSAFLKALYAPEAFHSTLIWHDPQGSIGLASARWIA
jgi:hypothetical protein